MAKQFSIIIITRNRAKIICNVLSTIIAMDFPREDFELIVVDNGSDDDTSGVVSSFMSATDIDWKIITEPDAGICRARNTGHAHVRSEWVAYLDDDALVPSNWLGAYQKAIRMYPDAAAFGGPATLDHRLIRPWWWCSKFDLTMSCQDYGAVMMAYKPYTHPYGLNMVFNNGVLKKYNGFDVMLDTILLGMADETDLFYRMQANAELLVYVPDSRVIHSVLPDRLTWGAFRKRCINVGQSFACLERRYHIRLSRPLVHRIASAVYRYSRHPTPAIFLKEYYEWYGYTRFKMEYLQTVKQVV